MALTRLMLCLLPGLLAVLLAVSPAALNLLTIPLFIGLPYTLGGVDGLKASLAWLARLPAPSAGPEDVAGRLCEAASLFTEHWKALQIRSEENVAAFRASCLSVLPSLDPALRSELERRLHAEVLQNALKAPPAVPQDPYVEDWRTCTSGYGRVAEAELFDTAGAIHSRTGVLPIKARRVKPSEVREAFARGEVVTFDGRGLIPARMFNATLQELSALHPDVAVHADSDGKHGLEHLICKGIFALTQNALAEAGRGGLLEWLARRGWADRVLADYCHKFWTLEEVVANLNLERAGFNLSYGRAEYAREIVAYSSLAQQGRGLLGSNVNVLRLPNWTRGDLDVPGMLAQLGLEGLAEHAHNFLWLGASPGGLHNDIQDNVLVQITGESQLLLIPSNCSYAPEMLGLHTGTFATSGPVEWLKSLGPDFSFFVIRLKPGDAVAIPSSTLHTVVSQDPGRIGMNFFIEPAHGKMRWPSAPANFFNFAGKGHLALRALWIRTVKEMWRTRPLGSPSFIVHGERQEIV